MATKASVILILVFLVTLPVLAARNNPTAPTPTPVKVVQNPVDVVEATPEATATVSVTDDDAAALVGDPVHGEDLFRHGGSDAPPCSSCHSTTVAGKGTGFAIGPGLKGIHERAATRVEGETAPQYIEDSIRHPVNFLVPGYNPIMYGQFAEKYSDQDIADIVAFLMTL